MADAAAVAANRELLASGRKRCYTCSQVKPLEEFGPQPNALGGRNSRCRACKAAAKADRYARLRAQVIAGYGGRCGCSGCPVSFGPYLSIDHVDGRGAEHRRTPGYDAQQLYKSLIADGFPPEYQLLCHNCNHAKEFGGCTPEAHQAG